MRRPLGVGVVVAVVLAACSGTGSHHDPQSDTWDRGSQPAADSHPTTSAPARLVIPSDVSGVSTAIADVDGDGRLEEVATYRSPDGGHYLSTRTAAGATSTIEVQMQSKGVDPIVATADIGTARDTVFVETAHTKTAFEIVPYAFIDDGWNVVEAATEGSPRLPIVLSGASGDVYGVSCRMLDDSPGLTLASLTQTEGGFLLTTTDYRLDGTTLQPVGDPIVQGAIIPTRDLSIDDSFSINCPRSR